MNCTKWAILWSTIWNEYYEIHHLT